MNSDAAKSFWDTQLRNAQKTALPFRIKNASQKATSKVLRKTLDFSQHQQSSITKASVLRAAWAIILAEYCDTKDVCFGSTVSGRNAPVVGLREMSGPMIATIPIRTRLDGGKSTAAFLKDVQAQSMEMTPYEQFGLQNIAQLHSAAKQACDFESLLVIQPVGDEGAAPGDIVLIPASQDKASNGAGELFNYPLVIDGRVSSTAVELIITYHENVITGKQAEAISHHFSHVTKQLLEQDNILLRDISVSGDWDLETAKEWDCEPRKAIKACLHDLISEQALKMPNKEAIFFPWESLSYKELDHVTDKFANHLWELGVRRETKIPFCFEKSMWAIIAMIGIMKAGGAFVPIDPNHPSDRRRTLLEEVDSSYLVVSPSTAPSCRGMADNMIELSPRFIRKLPTTDSDRIPDEDKPRPDDAVYTLFTSGSTGKPKGIVIEHSGICTSLQSQVKTFGITHQTRYLQFASYTFDASISEIFSTLIAGGTVCVPDESQRLQHITTFIKDVKVNMALLTPSFVRTFSPDQVPSLQTLIVGGEAPGADTLSIWQNRVRLINAYGPAETCIACASHVFTSQDDSPRTIGRNLVGANWIVSPESHNRLMPIGCVGELLVQGPALAREYMNDKAKTDSAFIHSVTWLCPTPGEPQRFYKTGDLVRYLPNGDIEYIGRNDSQVKLRGQRIELAEIESAIKEADSIVEHVAVEKIKTETGDSLVASITWANKDDSTTTESFVLTVDENMKPPIARIVDSIKLTLPPYMVPSYFLPLSSMPFGDSMKLDRNKIKTIMNSLSQEELGHYSVASTRERVEPTTEMEFKLRDVWAEVLAIPVQDIGKTDRFFEIGGDSIFAIHVVSLAQQHGIAVTVPQIFAHPELSQLADKATLSNQENPYETTPFSIMDPSQVDTVVTSASDQCQLAADQVIEDIYPCTPLQAGLLALAGKEPGSYISHYVYRLSDSVDVPNFIKAWDATVAVCGNLRTRIIIKDGVHLQALIKGRPSWLQTMEGETASSFIRRISTDTRMTYGDRLCQYALLTDGANDRYFYLAMHHAIFDGFSNAIALTTLQNIYRGAQISSLEPFSGFIKYTREMDHDAAKNYWMDQLRGATRASFPRSSDTTSDLTKPRQSRVLQRTMNLGDSSDKTITQATLLRATWALLLARYSDTSDICFGATVSGRDAPVAGLASMPGPMIATVPVRVRLHDHMRVDEYLRTMQDQTADMVVFEQFGLQNIAKLNEETRDACSFSSLLVVHPGRRSTASTEENILTPVTPRLSMSELPGGMMAMQWHRVRISIILSYSSVK
jgi:amino acid adenylation domain-containing protein